MPRPSAAAIVYAMGITQHITGTDNVKSLANLAMLTGNIGRPGHGRQSPAGTEQRAGRLRHGRAAATSSRLPGGDRRRPSAEVRGGLGRDAARKPGPHHPRDHGRPQRKGTIKALYIMGENPMMSDPDTDHVEKALKKLDLLVVQDIFLHETAESGPRGAAARPPGPKRTAPSPTPNAGYSGSARRWMHPGEALDDWEIIIRLIGKRWAPAGTTAARRRSWRRSAVTPSYAGITYDRIEHVGHPVALPEQGAPGHAHPPQRCLHPGQGSLHRVEHIPAGRSRPMRNIRSSSPRAASSTSTTPPP